MYRNQRSILPTWLSALLSIAFVLSGIAVALFAFLTVQHLLDQPADTGAAEAVVVEAQEEGALQPAVLQPPQIAVTQTSLAIAPTPAPTADGWQSSERINILLLGIDRRPGESFVSRTDSIMLISVDPETLTAGVLSVPRDLYVQIPGYGQNKINTAFVHGALQNNDYVDGAALAMQTLSYNLGVPIDHFLLVDFSAFTRLIDLIGGIYVDVPYEINDPLYPDANYGYDPLYIPAGVNYLDGAMALKYARTRHADSDFARAARQQQILMAVRRQAFDLGVTEMLRRLPSIYQQVEQGIRTDLGFEELLRLATTASRIDGERITSGVLDGSYVTSYRTPDGSSALLIRPDIALPFVQSILSN